MLPGAFGAAFLWEEFSVELILQPPQKVVVAQWPPRALMPAECCGILLLLLFHVKVKISLPVTDFVQQLPFAKRRFSARPLHDPVCCGPISRIIQDGTQKDP